MTITYKQKFNKLYGYPKDTEHSLSEIAKLSGYKLKGIKTIFSKGQGAFFSNPQSVRKVVKSANQWAYARVYSAVMNGKAAIVDASHLVKT